MNYLNLETKTLHSPEFIGCKPVARATWLSVSLWCAQQENGGRIVGARAWGNRQWQQTCGVTAAEVNGSAPLLVWEGDDLLVFAYPEDAESFYRTKRDSGGAGGAKKSDAKTQAARENGAKGGRPKTQAETEASTQAQEPNNPSQCNGKEGKEKEGKGREDCPAAALVFSEFGGPSKQEWLGRIEHLGHADWWEKKWFSAEKTGWMSGKSKIVSWQAHQDGMMQWFRSYAEEQAAKNAPPTPADDAAFEAERAAETARRTVAELAAQTELQAALAAGRE